MLQPDAFCEHTMQQNATGAPDPAGGAYSAPRPSSLRRGEEGREGRGREREEMGREGGEREGKLTLMRSWNRVADWLRPALDAVMVVK